MEPKNPEYRSFNSLFMPVEDREKHPYTVEGYATTFEPYDFYYDWREQILPTALNGAQMDDVIFQLNHDGAPLARMRNNSLELSIDEHGIFTRAYLGGSQGGRELYELISNGLIDRMSWGFLVDPDDGIELDYDNKIQIVRHVTRVLDVSAVSIPANEDTEIHARSYLDSALKKKSADKIRMEENKRKRCAALIKITNF